MGTQILKDLRKSYPHGTAKVLKYLILNTNTQIPLHVTHSPLRKTCPHALRGKKEFGIERHTESGAQTHNHQASLMGDWLAQARHTANGGSHYIHLGASPMQGVS